MGDGRGDRVSGEAGCAGVEPELLRIDRFALGGEESDHDHHRERDVSSPSFTVGVGSDHLASVSRSATQTCRPDFPAHPDPGPYRHDHPQASLERERPPWLTQTKHSRYRACRCCKAWAAVVTGGGAGIGAAIARRFAAHGATVEVGEIDAERVAALGDEPAITSTMVDVRDGEAVGQWADGVATRHDGIDVLVNNVGHYVRSVPFRHSDPEHWDELHEINLRHCSW